MFNAQRIRKECCRAVDDPDVDHRQNARDALEEIERLRGILLPIRVFCTATDMPNGRQLIARVANVNDVKLLQQNYNFCLTWNMDEE